MKNILHTTCLIAFFLLSFSASIHAQWNVPEDAKNMEAQDEPTFELVKQGKEIFKKNCASCHGNPGQANNLAAINATDLGSVKFMNENTLGTILFKINQGMGAMPSFKDKLNDEEKWNLVFYIKSFDQNFKISGEKTQSFIGKIELKTDESSQKVLANISVSDDGGNTKPNEGIEIAFYVKRYFGNLLIGEPISTNQLGTAALQFPDNIPGDENGLVEIIAAFKDADAFGSEMKSIQLNWGKPLHFKNEVLDRTLWGPNNRVPIWLLISYWSVTIGVWLVIIYVIFGILKIKKTGR